MYLRHWFAPTEKKTMLWSLEFGTVKCEFYSDGFTSVGLDKIFVKIISLFRRLIDRYAIIKLQTRIDRSEP